MSYFDYRVCLDVTARDYPFYSLIMAAMMRADTRNIELLKQAFPATWAELDARYHAPGGRLDGESTSEAE